MAVQIPRMIRSGFSFSIRSNGMYEPLRASLEMLHGELKRASYRFPPLYHELVFDMVEGGDVIMDKAATKIFQKSLTTPLPDGEWQLWHGPHDSADDGSMSLGHANLVGQWYGRFYGSKEGVGEFQRLAESAYLALSQFGKLDTEETGWLGFVDFLYSLALQSPTPLLRVSEGLWTWTGSGWSADWGDSAVNEDPAWVRSLRLNVFSASLAALTQVMEPTKILLVDWSRDDGNAVPGFRYLRDPDVDGPIGTAIQPSPEPLLAAPVCASLVQSIPEEQTHESAGSHAPLGLQTKSSDGTPEERLAHDYRFEWDVKVSKWHLRYRFGDAPMDVEDDYVNAQEGFKLYALVLKQNRGQIDCSELAPELPMPELRSAISADEYLELSKERTPNTVESEPLVDEDCENDLILHRKRLMADLEKAQLGPNETDAVKIRAKVRELDKYWGQIFNINGNVRRVPGRLQNHANKIRNAMDRCREKLMPTPKKDGMPHLAEYLAQIRILKGVCYCSLAPERPWTITLPDSAEA